MRAAVPDAGRRPLGDIPETTPSTLDGRRDRAPRERRPTLDDLGEWSFPASDPPATWTWETDGAAGASR
jgi:hypothetical protein